MSGVKKHRRISSLAQNHYRNKIVQNGSPVIRPTPLERYDQLNSFIQYVTNWNSIQFYSLQMIGGRRCFTFLDAAGHVSTIPIVSFWDIADAS